MAQHATAVDEMGEAQKRTEGQRNVSELLLKAGLGGEVMHILAAAPAVYAGNWTEISTRKSTRQIRQSNRHQCTSINGVGVKIQEGREMIMPQIRFPASSRSPALRTPADFEANDNGHDGGKEEQTEQTVRSFPSTATSPSSFPPRRRADFHQNFRPSFAGVSTMNRLIEPTHSSPPLLSPGSGDSSCTNSDLFRLRQWASEYNTRGVAYPFSQSPKRMVDVALVFRASATAWCRFEVCSAVAGKLWVTNPGDRDFHIRLRAVASLRAVVRRVPRHLLTYSVAAARKPSPPGSTRDSPWIGPPVHLDEDIAYLNTPEDSEFDSDSHSDDEYAGSDWARRGAVVPINNILSVMGYLAPEAAVRSATPDMGPTPSSRRSTTAPTPSPRSLRNHRRTSHSKARCTSRTCSRRAAQTPAGGTPPMGQLAPTWASPGGGYPPRNHTSSATGAHASSYGSRYPSPATGYASPTAGYTNLGAGLLYGLQRSVRSLAPSTRATGLQCVRSVRSSPRALASLTRHVSRAASESSSHRYRDSCQPRMRIPRRIRWSLRMRGSSAGGGGARAFVIVRPLKQITAVSRDACGSSSSGGRAHAISGKCSRRGKAIPEAAGMRSIEFMGDQVTYISRILRDAEVENRSGRRRL
ncbi:hypothetical protein B0H17DRAFT_1174746 [Mycena rosella]|uniref:Uncharacterized protein n=1 Tax=Mycena rosella TaxID=1033263 RepID=A0AAD7GWC8_MYCRO|nr:hypothetical protein B0H17DRAFT_1174746 [Mycena rosella]